MFRRVLLRSPTENEVQALSDVRRAAQTEFESDPAARDAFLVETGQPETPDELRLHRASMAVVASVILNLDETLTKP